jgi:hypothetical protein
VTAAREVVFRRDCPDGIHSQNHSVSQAISFGAALRTITGQRVSAVIDGSEVETVVVSLKLG